MTKEDKAKVIQGFVFHNNRWISIEKKCEFESLRVKAIEDGYVQFQGEWISIHEKLVRVQGPQKEKGTPVVYNKTVNRQVYNVQKKGDTIYQYSDNRSYQTPENQPRSIEIHHSISENREDREKLPPSQSQDIFPPQKPDQSALPPPESENNS